MNRLELIEEIKTTASLNGRALSKVGDVLCRSRERREEARRRVEKSDEVAARATRVLRQAGYLR
jgi:hypothetical protein